MNSRHLVLMMLLLAAGLALGACSDEPYGSLYCPPGARDTLVVYPRLDMQQVRVEIRGSRVSNEPGMAGMQSLYLGSEAGTSSDILVNFDLDKGSLASPTHPDSLFDEAHIRRVSLNLDRLRPYYSVADTTGTPTLGIIYLVQQLANPFSLNQYETWPGETPESEGPPLNTEFEVSHSWEPSIRLWVDSFLALVESNEGEIGMVISAAAGSDPGLVGFASRDLTRFELIGPLPEGSNPAPTIVVEFEDGTIPNLLIPPVNDTSTFHQVAALPPDQVQVQSGLPSYSVLAFDIPPLPAGTCVTGLGFRLTPVNTSSLWAGECLVTTSLDSTRVSWANGSLSQLPYWSEVRLSACPVDQPTDRYLGFGPDTGFVGPLAQVIHMISLFEDYPGWISEIYFSQSTFHGPGAAAELRPALMIITGRKDD